MFNHIGRKIKTLAKVICWLGIILSVILGIVMIAIGTQTIGDTRYQLLIGGVMSIIVGVIGSWIGSFLLYGFGQLVDNSDIRTEIAVKNDKAN